MINQINNYSKNSIGSIPQAQRSAKSNSNPSFGAVERTFMLLKPDSFERRLAEPIKKILGRHADDLKIVQVWRGVAPRTKLEQNYVEHRGKTFFDEWMEFLQSNQVEALVIEGENAVSRTNLLKQITRTVFAPGERRYNLIHSSDTPEDAEREISNFFDGLSDEW